MKVGIDKIGVYIPKYYLDIRELANKRGIDPDKFSIGLGQEYMSVTDRSQDIVTMGAMAASKILTEKDKEKIGLLIIGTETGVDQSKAASTYIHSLLGINPYCRTFEIKEACYGATAALLYAKEYIKSNPGKSALVIASDIAKYGIGSSGESTQGAGAIAMLITKKPRICVVEDNSTFYTEDVMDFYRPNKFDYALVNGKLSTTMYLKSLDMVYKRYCEKNYDVNFANICFHIPYPKLGLKGLRQIRPEMEDKFSITTYYNSKVGNIYTGSIFLSLYSLLSQSEDLKVGDRIGMYSYGSGAVSEFFAVKLCSNFKLDKLDLSDRIKISVEEYEKIFYEKLEDNVEYSNLTDQEIYLLGIYDNTRKYVKI